MSLLSAVDRSDLRYSGGTLPPASPINKQTSSNLFFNEQKNKRLAASRAVKVRHYFIVIALTGGKKGRKKKEISSTQKHTQNNFSASTQKAVFTHTRSRFVYILYRFI